MARKNDLEVSPAQEAEGAQQGLRARVPSPSRTNDKDRADTGENGNIFRSLEDDNVQQEGTTDAGSRYRGQLDDNDAEDLAVLINDASLSGANLPGTKPADKASEGTLSRTFNFMTGFFASSSQKLAESSGGNNNLTSQSSAAQNRGTSLQVSAQEIPDNSAALSEDRTALGKSLARPKAIYEDISKMQKPRRSGRPDPYDVPQSPPRNPTPEPKASAPKLRGTEPKRVVTLEKPERAAMAAEEAPVNAEKAPGRAMRAMPASDPTRAPAAEPVEPQDNLQDLSKTKPQLKSKDPAFGRRDTQLRENIQVTPTKRHDEVGKGSAQQSAQSELQSVSPILSGPTPTKGIQESPRRLQRPSQRPSLVPKATQGGKPNTSSQQLAKEQFMRSPASARIPHSAHDEASDEEDNLQHESDVSRVSTPRATASGPKKDGVTSFITEETLQHLRETIMKAGQNAKGERVIRDDNYWTAIAGTLTRGLTRLISKYKAMNDLMSASVVDVGKFDVEHQKALKCIDIIREKAQAVLTNRLGDPRHGERNADKMSRSHMLEDLYLYVIPDLVEALYRAVESRQDRDALEISDLEEFYALLEILHDLVKASRAEDKYVQPKAPRTNKYSISQPTNNLWSTLRKLYKDCGSQLAARKVARRAEQLRQTAPERARKRKERLEAEERTEEEQFQQRLRERNKAIIASLNERRAELGLPPCSQPIEAPSTRQHPQTPKYKEEDQFDDVDHEMNGRLIGVFGRNNSHPGTTPKEWTKVEMEMLVDGLRQERGTYSF
jgi:hypothetical protein